MAHEIKKRESESRTCNDGESGQTTALDSARNEAKSKAKRVEGDNGCAQKAGRNIKKKVKKLDRSPVGFVCLMTFSRQEWLLALISAVEESDTL